MFAKTRGVGSIKRFGGGALSDIEKGTKKFFPGNVGGTKKNFLVILYRNCTFLSKFFLKTSKFPNKKGTRAPLMLI